MKRILTFPIVLTLAAAILSACNAEGPEPPEGNVSPSAANSARGGPPSGQPASETVRFESDGGAEIVGTFYPASEPDSPAILFLHQWYSDRKSFDEFARTMQKGGFASLAIDGRGFGESIRTKAGDPVKVSSSTEAFKAMLSDVDNAFRLLAGMKNVDPSRIAIVGSSYGSSQAINYAAEHEEVRAVALLSPGLNYFDTMPTASAAANYGGRPLFLVTGREDADSLAAVNEMDKLTAGKGKSSHKIYEGKAHGTDLFKSGSTLEVDLREFLIASLKDGKS